MKDTVVLQAIRERRSIRKYTGENIPDTVIEKILDAGRWAPSGLNNQPWRFAVVRNRGIREEMSRLTCYRGIVVECDLCVAVLYNHNAGYDRDKDLMGIGACVQNMLLAAYSQGVGAVWLGEILKRKKDVNVLLGIDEENELMAVLAMGFSAETPEMEREPLDNLVLKRI
jgi:nitroreductase